MGVLFLGVKKLGTNEVDFFCVLDAGGGVDGVEGRRAAAFEMRNGIVSCEMSSARFSASFIFSEKTRP